MLAEYYGALQASCESESHLSPVFEAIMVRGQVLRHCGITCSDPRVFLLCFCAATLRPCVCDMQGYIRCFVPRVCYVLPPVLSLFFSPIASRRCRRRRPLARRRHKLIPHTRTLQLAGFPRKIYTFSTPLPSVS